MRFPTLNVPRAILCAIAGAAALLEGCGTADYEHVLHERLNNVRASAPFRTLFAPTELPDTPIKIRVPMIFKNSYTEDSKHPDDGARIKPERVQPPFLQIPGFKVCYENKANGGDGLVPYYCYLAAIPSKAGDAAKLQADLQASLKAKFKDTPDDWEPVDANTPDNKGLPWKKIRVTADQPFFVRSPADGTLIAKDLPGIFELWLYDADDWIVLVGWRTPTSVEGKNMAAQIITSPTGAVSQVTADAKLDMKEMPQLTAGTVTIDKATAAPPPAAGAG